MTLIFWQNIVSPHQLPYIREISKVEKRCNVLLVVEKQMTLQRKGMGWNTQVIDDTANFKIIIEPNKKTIDDIFIANPEAQHFFSGIQSNAMVHSAFIESLKYELKRHLIVEGPFMYKYPFFAHYIKSLLKDYKNYKHISKVFAIGSHALNWYPKFNFKRNQIIPFSYCVEKITTQKIANNSGRVKLLFVGGLNHRKGVDILLKSLFKINRDYSLDIVGDGDQRQLLEEYCTRNSINNVNFLGTKNNEDIRNLFHNYDVHILPSRHDGWGAVVNEALMAGLFVLCSDACGAQELIKNKFNGIVFSHKKKNDLYTALLYCIENVNNIREKKSAILNWSICIEGTTIANYFVTALQSESRITPPWR
ncbi:glycosyltransferase family 4 protein [Bizionia gelidisalsuginis]|uniref:Glycosyltransferase family 4 protein n=1 Tax=Bizionia gelidisalsuginis TaxID=291188 RepID=A0ABY3M7C0_9FLAO|nr:glycosyltransferase family 4 protein [Bizionia gelidisalsuginis]TYC08804.1 glycosyltransferase family 4 protein [Bizionia gelidisalsuginis]